MLHSFSMHLSHRSSIQIDAMHNTTAFELVVLNLLVAVASITYFMAKITCDVKRHKSVVVVH